MAEQMPKPKAARPVKRKASKTAAASSETVVYDAFAGVVPH